MRTSNPPSYDKIFQIYVGSTATVTQYPTSVSSGVTDAMLIPLHRGLLVMTTAQVVVDFYNLDHKVAANKLSETTVSKSTVTIPANTFLVLPLQIAYYKVTSGSGSLYLYGLL